MESSDYFTTDVSVITVDGGHLGIFREPGIRKTGEKLGDALTEMNNQMQFDQKHNSVKYHTSSHRNHTVLSELPATNA